MKKGATINNLYRILGIVKGVTSHRWEMVRTIVSELNSNKKVKILKKEWADEFKRKNLQYYPLDLNKIETWSTFDLTCIDLSFVASTAGVLCNVKIYDGNTFGGDRQQLKFKAEILLEKKFLTHLESQILYSLDQLAEERYEQHLEAQKQQWTHDFKWNILSEL